jgi:ubiquinone/menaquinone biosynthesis C-methylase UbiE
MSGEVPFYDRTYGGFHLGARERVRRETYGEDLGQNSWLTAEEWRTFAGWLGVTEGSRVLDVGCGSGGPALYLAQAFLAQVTGADHNPEATATATRLAEQQGLSARSRFVTADAGRPLPLDAGRFDAIVCIDAINHLPDRAGVLRDWHRLLAPGGRLLFTDPIVVTGLISHEEVAARSSIGYFLFAPPGEDERLLQEAGFEVLRRADTTEQVAAVARRWLDARVRHRAELLDDEGAATFEGTQRFLTVVHALANERRLSRFAFLAQASVPAG